MKWKRNKAIAKPLIFVLLVAVVIFSMSILSMASEPNRFPIQLAQTNSNVDAAVARATVNQLMEGAQNPQRQPEVYRTIVEDNHALATWRWGEAGGQTVLAKQDGQWVVLTVGGGAVDIVTLQDVGVPEAIARRLIERDRAAWQ